MMIGRRDFALGLVATAGAMLPPRSAEADLECRDFRGGRVCTAGILSPLIGLVAVRNPQFQSQWCWAACISMLFGFHGHPVSQARIVKEAFGGIVNMPGRPLDILRMINRSWTDDLGFGFTSMSSMGGTTPAAIAGDLAVDQPIIIGSLGHATVLTAMTYGAPLLGFDYYGQPIFGTPVITDVIVRDPWPGRGRRSFSALEWSQVSFAAHVRVS